MTSNEPIVNQESQINQYPLTVSQLEAKQRGLEARCSALQEQIAKLMTQRFDLDTQINAVKAEIRKARGVRMTPARKAILGRLAAGEIIIYGQRMTTPDTWQIRDTVPAPMLQAFKDAGWIEMYTDDLAKRQAWRITPAGRAASGTNGGDNA